MAEEISNKDLKEAFDLLDFNKEGVVDIFRITRHPTIECYPLLL